MESEKLSIPVFRDEERTAVVAAAKKQLVYLDSNIWIHIAEQDQEVVEQCRRAVRTCNTLFPVSDPAVAEVIDQPNSLQRSRVATLMDELSEGVSFRFARDIQMLEADQAHNILLGNAEVSIGRELVLCWVVERLGRVALEFPPNWNREDAKNFTELVAQQSQLRSVKWLVDHLPDDEMRVRHAKSLCDYVQKMAATIAKSVPHFQGLVKDKDKRRKRLLLEERVWVVKNVLAPRATRNLLKVVGPDRIMNVIAAIAEQVGEGNEQRLEQIMRAIPCLDLQCHIMAERTSNHTRRVRGQDYYDVEHAIVGAAYADVFVTSDRHLYDLLTRRCKVPIARGCQVLLGVGGLRTVLNYVAS